MPHSYKLCFYGRASAEEDGFFLSKGDGYYRHSAFIVYIDNTPMIV